MIFGTSDVKKPKSNFLYHNNPNMFIHYIKYDIFGSFSPERS